MRCPNCHTANIGLIAEERFYCWNCYVEISPNGNLKLVSELEPEDQVHLEDLFVDE